MEDKKPKILFTDLDGTLLDDQKEIEQDTKKAISDMLAAGYYFAICTGRPLESAKFVAKKYGLNGRGCYIVAYNGGTVYDPVKDKLISYASIPNATAWKLIHKAKEAGLYVHTYDKVDDTVLALYDSAELEYYTKTSMLPWKAGMDCIQEGMTEDPPKVMLASLTDYESLKKFKEENAFWTDSCMNSFFSCNEYLEYCPLNASKGMGLQKLCDYLQIQAGDAVAAGDERNDIALLQAAGIAAVPANAHPDVCAYADYICKKDNNQGAIGEIIHHFFAVP